MVVVPTVDPTKAIVVEETVVGTVVVVVEADRADLLVMRDVSTRHRVVLVPMGTHIPHHVAIDPLAIIVDSHHHTLIVTVEPVTIVAYRNVLQSIMSFIMSIIMMMSLMMTSKIA